MSREHSYWEQTIYHLIYFSTGSRFGGQSQVPALCAKNVHNLGSASIEDCSVNVRILALNWLDPRFVNVTSWDPVLSEKPDFTSDTQTSWWCCTSCASCRERFFWGPFQYNGHTSHIHAPFKDKVKSSKSLYKSAKMKIKVCTSTSCLTPSPALSHTLQVTANITESLKIPFLLSSNGVTWVQNILKYKTKKALSI